MVQSGASIDLVGLEKRYGAAIALDGVDLNIQAGEFMTLLGPSGSGKTTTLNAIAGFVDIDEGSIGVDGKDISKVPPHRRNLGMVFQNYALFPHMTVTENIAFPLRRRGMAAADRARKIREILGAVHLERYADRMPAELSGGQQQRVALARALVYEPPVLLMDEPLGALDKKLRESLQMEIKRIHREVGTTFVYVTHDQEEALVLSDRIAIYSDGRIRQVGSAEELYERPADTFVADFIGEGTLFGGEISSVGAGVVTLETGCGSVSVAGTAQVGAEMAVLVRPEVAEVTTERGDSSDRSFVEGIVTEVVYVGSGRKVFLSLHGDVSGIVWLSKERAFSAVPGDRVFMSWAPDAAVLLAV